MKSNPACPECGSHDTPPYRWPKDPVTVHYLEHTPDAHKERVCMDCRHQWRAS